MMIDVITCMAFAGVWVSGAVEFWLMTREE